jgi:hypothetical protein
VYYLRADVVVGATPMNIDDRRQKFREQLLYEFLNPKQTKKKPNKSPSSLCKKAKFLKNPRKAKQKGEIPL